MSLLDRLDRLTFIGGTCLRTCYGSPWRSEKPETPHSPARYPTRYSARRVDRSVPGSLLSSYYARS